MSYLKIFILVERRERDERVAGDQERGRLVQQLEVLSVPSEIAIFAIAIT